MSEVQKAYDDLAEAYDDFHTDGKSLAENRRIGRYLSKLIEPRDTVVDLGCGTGLLLDLVDLPPERYVGVDISAKMLTAARDKHPGYRFVEGNLEIPIEPLAGARFDLAISLFGSPSYCQLAPVADNVRGLLKPGGRYFLMYCGPDYLSRSTYINQGKALLMPHSTRELAAVYPEARIWGMSSLVDRVPNTWPAPVLDALLRVDVHTVGRFAKDACFFLNVEGTRYP